MFRRRPGVEGFRLGDSRSRSPLSLGIEWAVKVTTLGMTFAIPALLGSLVDRFAAKSHVGLLVGMVVGFGAGMLQILKLARDASRPAS